MKHTEQCMSWNSVCAAASPAKIFMEANKNNGSKGKIRIRLKGFDHQMVDQSCEKIVENRKAHRRQGFGPVPFLPRRRS